MGDTCRAGQAVQKRDTNHLKLGELSVVEVLAPEVRLAGQPAGRQAGNQ